MYEIGRFAVIGEHEPEPIGFLPIRILPHSHYMAFPWWDDTTKAVLEVMAEDVKPGMRVLDFGCGASAILSLAAKALGATPYPVEIHPEIAMLASAQVQGVMVLTHPGESEYDYVVANVGDAVLVGEVSNLAPHGVGTDAAGELVRW